MAVQEPIKIDDDGWYFHADEDGAGAKLILRRYASGSDTEFTEHGEFRTFPEAASGYIDAKYAYSVRNIVGASLSAVLAGKKSLLATFKSGFTGNNVRAAKIVLKGDA